MENTTYEIQGEAHIAHGHVVRVIDVGEADYRIEIQRPNDGGKTAEIVLTETEAEALMQALMDAVG